MKQIARDNNNLDDERLGKKLAKKLKNPCFFTDRSLKAGLKINLDSHRFIHANSKLTIAPNYPEFGIEVRYINKNVKGFSVIYARLINQYIFKNQTVLLARFDKQDEDNQVLDETDLLIILNINPNLTETDIDNIDFKSPLENQIQEQEMEDSGWRFDKINSMTVYCYKTGEMNGSSYVKTPLRSNAILNSEKNEKYCFIWSTLASFHPCNNKHPKRVSICRQYFIELNNNGFDFTNGVKCSDVHNFEVLNKLSINI